VADDARRPRHEDRAVPSRGGDRAARERRALRAVPLGIAEGGKLAWILDVASRLARRQEVHDERVSRTTHGGGCRQPIRKCVSVLRSERFRASLAERHVPLDPRGPVVDVRDVVPDTEQVGISRPRHTAQQAHVEVEGQRIERGTGCRVGLDRDENRPVVGRRERAFDLDWSDRPCSRPDFLGRARRQRPKRYASHEPRHRAGLRSRLRACGLVDLEGHGGSLPNSTG